MAEIIYPEDTGCDFISAEEIKTHENRGVALKPTAPDPKGWWRMEKQMIEVGLFDLNCPEPWVRRQEITMKQAQELGQWLTSRAKEAERGRQWERVRRMLRFGRD